MEKIMTPLMQSLKVSKTVVALQFGGSKVSALTLAPALTALAWRRQFGKKYAADAIAMSLVKSYLKRKVDNTTSSVLKTMKKGILERMVKFISR
jgi:hypothetical protein